MERGTYTDLQSSYMRFHNLVCDPSGPSAAPEDHRAVGSRFVSAMSAHHARTLYKAAGSAATAVRTARASGGSRTSTLALMESRPRNSGSSRKASSAWAIWSRTAGDDQPDGSLYGYAQ